MNLYESISNQLSNNTDKKEILEVMNSLTTTFEENKNKREELYVRIIGLCPKVFNEEIDLFLLRYLYLSADVENIKPSEMIETYLISKGCKDETNDFSKLVELIIEYIYCY